MALNWYEPDATGVEQTLDDEPPPAGSWWQRRQADTKVGLVCLVGIACYIVALAVGA